MNMELRKAGPDDIGLLLENRLEFVRLIKNIEHKDDFAERTKKYMEKHINNGTLLTFIALDDGKIVSCCILCIYETLPTPSCLSGKYGLLLNVNTSEDYRRRGVAYSLLTMLIKEAKDMGVGKIQLTYTDDGYPLYQKLGFVKAGREMSIGL